MLPRRFALVRHVDYTGVSGVGVVAYGVAFADGHIALRWSSDHPATSVWTSMDDLLAVHGHGQATSVEWIDAPHGELEDLPAHEGGRRARAAARVKQEQPQAEAADDDRDTPPEPERQHESRPTAGTAGTNGHPGSDTAPLLVGEQASAGGPERQQDTAPRASRPGRHRRPEVPNAPSDRPQ